MEQDTNNSVYLGWALMPLLAALATLTYLLEGKRRLTTSTANVPPGPWQLPVIGSLHHLVGRGQLPHSAMRDLARRYGPVMLLRLGEVPTLVLSSPDAAREVMKTHDRTFATRPLSTVMRVMSFGGRDIIFGPYGERWRQLRRIAVTELLTARRVRSFRAIREEEVAAMLGRVLESAAAGRPVEMRTRLSTLVADSTFRAVLGDRCTQAQRDLFLRELDAIVRLGTGLHPTDLWPSSWLAGRLSNAVRRAEGSHVAIVGIIDDIIQEHLEGEGQGDGEVKEDLLDVLLKIHKDGVIDMVAVQAVIFDMFVAGSETSATTLEWAMAELINNPAVMNKATTEVRRVFEADGTVAEDRLGDLSYLHLVIRETLRLHPPAPLLLPRECREPCKVLGLDVPRGTKVLVNVWAMGRDSQYWPDAAEEFRPERFESAGTGTAAAVDFRGTDFELLPFGAGRRMCPGMAFGLANVELPLASLLLHFDWEALDPAAKLDMTEAFGITLRLKANLLLRPSLRMPLQASPPVTATRL